MNTNHFYSGSRWRKVYRDAYNAYPAKLLLYFIRVRTAIFDF
jgi:hypothetical protein